jgi:hypothetical protein
LWRLPLYTLALEALAQLSLEAGILSLQIPDVIGSHLNIALGQPSVQLNKTKPIMS